MKLFKMKKKPILLIALCLTMLFALSTSAFAFDDPEMECMPRPEPPKFRHCMPARPFCMYLQLVDDDLDFDYYTSVDFGWEHYFPFCGMPGVMIESAKLRVRAWDVDSDYDGPGPTLPEMDEVLVNGVPIGYLEGYGGEWSITELDVPCELICGDGELDVWLDIDKNNDGWLVEVESSELEVIYRCGHYRWRRLIICD